MNDLNSSRKPAAVRRADGYLFLLAGFNPCSGHDISIDSLTSLSQTREANCLYCAEPNHIRNIKTMQSQTEIFTELRPVLMTLALRILGSAVEAEDMVQETYLRWERAAATEVRSPKAFLTTIVTRLCLNHLKLARVRLEHADA